LCRVLGGPTFSFTMHGSDEVDGVLKLSLPQKAAAAKFVVAVSEFGRSQLCRWCPVEVWDDIHVVHCGLDPDFLDGRTSIPDTHKLVCVGRLCREKAQPLLVRALERVAERGLPFEVDLVGDGPLRSLVEAEIRRAGLQDRIRITGYVSSDEVRRSIESARATVLPSFIEGIPVVLMESLARGRPVISTYVGGIPELVVSGENGWLVPAGSVDALADAIAEVLTASTDALDVRGEVGAARVHRDHCARTEAERLVAHFEG
ncbi:MAG: glycosyltransferase family 4 protein, partial [Planctomycetota bacterium]